MNKMTSLFIIYGMALPLMGCGYRTSPSPEASSNLGPTFQKTQVIQRGKQIRLSWQMSDLEFIAKQLPISFLQKRFFMANVRTQEFVIEEYEFDDICLRCEKNLLQKYTLPFPSEDFITDGLWVYFYPMTTGETTKIRQYRISHQTEAGVLLSSPQTIITQRFVLFPPIPLPEVTIISPEQLTGQNNYDDNESKNFSDEFPLVQILDDQMIAALIAQELEQELEGVEQTALQQKKAEQVELENENPTQQPLLSINRPIDLDNQTESERILSNLIAVADNPSVFLQNFLAGKKVLRFSWTREVETTQFRFDSTAPFLPTHKLYKVNLYKSFSLRQWSEKPINPSPIDANFYLDPFVFDSERPTFYQIRWVDSHGNESLPSSILAIHL